MVMDIAQKTLQLKQDFDDVYEAGKKAEYDAFWDEFQAYGQRRSYNYAFRGISGADVWTSKTWSPKYSIIATGDAQQAFYNMGGDENNTLDMCTILENNKIELDLSGATNCNNLFAYSRISTLPVIDVSSATSRLENAFRSQYLTSIKTLIVSENNSFNNTFTNATKLVSLTLAGVIAQNGFNVSACPLDSESLASIVDALKKYEDGSTHSITFGSTNVSKLTDAQKATISQKGWSFT